TMLAALVIAFVSAPSFAHATPILAQSDPTPALPAPAPAVGPATASAPATSPPTFHETIEPLLQSHCAECHHEGGGAPFSLEKYDDVIGWSAQIREVVTTRRMPPWGADRTVGRFANDRSLPQSTIDTIASWIDGGSKEGDPAKAPPPRSWPTSWSLP